MNKEEIFTSVTLPSGISYDILEGKGIHYFNALSESKGDNGLTIKHLLCQLVKGNGKNISVQEIDDMDIRDVSYLAEVISTMLSRPVI